MRSDPIAAVDVGTSAVRTALVAADGTLVRESRRARAPGAGNDFDALELLDEVGAALRELRVERCAALVISAHVGWVLVDEALEPISRAGGWADTTGLASWSSQLGVRLDTVLHRSGRPRLTGGGLAAALAAGGAARWMLSPKDFLVARLTGVVHTDATTAAYSGGLEVCSRSWMTDEFAALGLDPEIAPPLCHGDDIVGAVTAEGARRSGVAVGTPVVSGGPDGTVGALHVLADRPAAIADVAGTTDVLVLPVDDPRNAPAGAVLNPGLHGAWTAGGSTGATGGGVDWWARAVGFEGLADAAAREPAVLVGPGSADTGPLCDPQLSGSRFPEWRSERRGALANASAHDDRVAILRAAIEGAAFVVRAGLDVLDPARRLPVALVGGAARSRSLAQLRADVTRRSVLLADQPDATLLGAARLAATALGRSVPPAAELETIEPDSGRGAVSDERYTAWRRSFGVNAPTDRP